MFGVVTPGKIIDYFVLNDKSKINLHEAKTFIVEKYTTCNVLDSVWRQIAVKWNISGYNRLSFMSYKRYTVQCFYILKNVK